MKGFHKIVQHVYSRCLGSQEIGQKKEPNYCDTHCMSTWFLSWEWSLDFNSIANILYGYVSSCWYDTELKSK